jgi:ADP-heptose:LPS heptosyltransferase
MGRYFLQNIHEQFPEARLAIVVASRGEMIRDLCASSPWLEVIETNRRDVRGLWKLWKEFHGSDSTVTQYTGKVGTSFGLASKLAARALTKRGGLVGFADAFAWNTLIYDSVLPLLPDAPVVEHERSALRASGLSVRIPYPLLPMSEDAATLVKFMCTADSYLLFHFFAGNKGRSISPTKAHDLLVDLRSRLPDLTFVISGASTDLELAEEIGKGISGTIVLAGKASLQEMMYLITDARGVVSVDTGIAHISAHLRKPLVVLRTCLWPNWWFPEAYGPEAPILQFSEEKQCHPHIARDYPVCINDIPVSDVAQKSSDFFTI